MKLPIWPILRDTFLIPLRHPREFFRALALPGLAIVVVIVGSQFASLPQGVRWAIHAVYGALLTVFAVTCHRLVLLGPSPETLAPRLRWGLRETRFFGWLILLVVAFAVGRVLFITLFGNVYLQAFRPSSSDFVAIPKIGVGLMRTADYVGIVFSSYVVSRLSLVLPASALDLGTHPRSAWQRSEGNGWRLTLTVGAFPWILSYGVELMLRANATTPELVALIVLNLFASMLGIVALSLSYQDLVGNPAGGGEAVLASPPSDQV